MIKFKGADINGKNNKGITPLLLNLQTYAIHKNKESLEKLLYHDSDVTFGSPITNFLLNSIKLSNKKRFKVIEKLLEYKCDINSIYSYYHTPLISTIITTDNQKVNTTQKNEKKKLDMMNFLIERGARVNQQNDDGKTALHEACKSSSSSSVEMIKLLLKSNADVTVVDNNNKQPVNYSNSSAIKTILFSYSPLLISPAIPPQDDDNNLNTEFNRSSKSNLLEGLNRGSGSNLDLTIDRKTSSSESLFASYIDYDYYGENHQNNEKENSEKENKEAENETKPVQEVNEEEEEEDLSEYDEETREKIKKEQLNIKKLIVELVILIRNNFPFDNIVQVCYNIIKSNKKVTDYKTQLNYTQYQMENINSLIEIQMKEAFINKSETETSQQNKIQKSGPTGEVEINTENSTQNGEDNDNNSNSNNNNEEDQNESTNNTETKPKSVSKPQIKLFDRQGKNGEYPLHLAIAMGNIQIVEFLIINQLVNVNLPDKQGNYPLTIACSLNDPIITPQILQLLVGGNANPTIAINQSDDDGNTVLHFPIIYHSPEILQQILFPENQTSWNTSLIINYKNHKNQTPFDVFLGSFIYHQNLSSMRLIINARCSVPNHAICSYLIDCISLPCDCHFHFMAISMLMEAGASINSLYLNLYTPLLCCIYSYNNVNNLIAYAKRNDVLTSFSDDVDRNKYNNKNKLELIDYLLSNCRANINQILPSNHRIALHEGIQKSSTDFNDEKLIKLLLSHGSNVNHRDNTEKKPGGDCQSKSVQHLLEIYGQLRDDRTTLLFEAVKSNQFNLMVQILKEWPHQLHFSVELEENDTHYHKKQTGNNFTLKKCWNQKIIKSSEKLDKYLANSDRLREEKEKYKLFLKKHPLRIALGKCNLLALELMLLFGANPNHTDHHGKYFSLEL